jgi:pyruvate dehydrogenase (quinone)
VPPLPPHITFEQAKHFAQAVLGGDPHGGRVVRHSLRQMLDAIRPGR